MKKFLTFLFCFLMFNAFSQNFGWDKEEKNGVYLDCISSAEKAGSLDTESKENLCLCYLEKIKDKYSYEEYENKIDVQKKRLKKNNIDNCASELGIAFGSESKVVAVADPTSIATNYEETILGVWSFEKGLFSFYQDNEYKYEGKVGKCRGTWRIQGQFLMIDSKFCSNEKFEIVKIDDSEIIMYRVKRKKLYHLKRQK